MKQHTLELVCQVKGSKSSIADKNMYKFHDDYYRNKRFQWDKRLKRKCKSQIFESVTQGGQWLQNESKVTSLLKWLVCIDLENLNVVTLVCR